VDVRGCGDAQRDRRGSVGVTAGGYRRGHPAGTARPDDQGHPRQDDWEAGAVPARNAAGAAGAANSSTGAYAGRLICVRAVVGTGLPTAADGPIEAEEAAGNRGAGAS